VLNPESIESCDLSQDVKRRANYYLSQIGASIGAYSDVVGYPFIR